MDEETKIILIRIADALESFDNRLSNFLDLAANVGIEVRGNVGVEGAVETYTIGD